MRQPSLKTRTFSKKVIFGIVPTWNEKVAVFIGLSFVLPKIMEMRSDRIRKRRQ